MTPLTARASVLGRLAAVLLIALIVSPVTAPFSAVSGSLEASPSGPADNVKSETTQASDALVEVVVVHVEPSSTVVRLPPPVPTARVEYAHVNRILRL
jgi:hypothetical protein